MIDGMEKIIFDTDIGGDPDDALALAYLLSRPDCELLGVTIEAWGGNGPRQAEIASAICLWSVISIGSRFIKLLGHPRSGGRRESFRGSRQSRGCRP